MTLRSLAATAALAACLAFTACDSASVSETTGAPLAEARPDTEAVCHYDEEASVYVRLDLPAPAAAAHRRHGDAAPGTGGLDEACQPVEAEPYCPCFDAADLQALPSDQTGRPGYLAEFGAVSLSSRQTMLLTSLIPSVWAEVRVNAQDGASCLVFDVVNGDNRGVPDLSLEEAEGCRLLLYAEGARRGFTCGDPAGNGYCGLPYTD